MKPERKPIVRACGTCEFSDKHPVTDAWRICRFSFFEVDGMSRPKWATVDAKTDWCGRYKERIISD